MNGIVMSCYGKATTTWDKKQKVKKSQHGKRVFPEELELNITQTS
jgi:hypothetical protein